MATAWDAFISYARAASEPTAIAVQRGLERFARPWHERRAVRVFRDDSAMSTNPALWSSLEQGLTAAGHLIVLLSPAARDSAYVDKEVSWWLANKGTDTILLVLDAGELGWDADANRFSADSAVPPCLREAFPEEPRWLDLRWLRDSPSSPAADPRFAAAMADLSAPIRGLPRDELVGEDLTQHRRVRRLARSAVSLLVLLLGVSVITTVFAVQQRDDVLRQAVTLRSRELAAASSGLLDSDLRLAQLLAVEGYRTEPSAATMEALRQAVFASPLVERFASFDAEITAIAPAGDAGQGASIVAVGLADGQIYTLPVDGSSAPRLRLSLPTAVTSLRASDDGEVLLAATGDRVSVWDPSGLRELPGQGTLVSPDAIALSPSGRQAVVVRDDQTVRLDSYDTATGRELDSRRDPLLPGDDEPLLYPQYTEHVAFLDEHTLRLVGNDARWLSLDLRTGKTGRLGTIAWAPYANLYVASGRADYLLAAPISNGQSVQAWSLDRTGDDPAPQRAGVQLTDPLGLAISPDGRLVLVNDSSSGLSVAPVSLDDPPLVPTTRVAGLSGVGAMAFLSPTLAVVAARTELAFLSFGRFGRGAEAAKLSPRGVGALPGYAVDFRNSRLAVSPDGSRVAVLELSGAELQVVPLPGRTGDAVPPTSVGSVGELDPLFGPVWVGDDTVLVVSSAERETVERLPTGVLRWNLVLPSPDPQGGPEAPIAVAVPGDGTVLIATSGGSLQTRSAADAALQSTLWAAVPGQEYELASFSPDLRHLALVAPGDYADDGTSSVPTLRIVAAATGELVHEQRWPDGTEIAGLEFAGTTVVVSRLDGSVDLVPDLGRGAVRRISTAGVRTSTGSVQRYPPVVGSGGLVGLPTRSGLQLYDLATEHPAGTLPVPPGFEGVPRGYAFAPDGHTLVTGFFGADARTAGVSVRDLDAGAVVVQACASAGGSISASQWRRVTGSDLPAELACR